MKLGEGALGEAIARGTAYVAGDHEDRHGKRAKDVNGMRACIPLAVDGEVVGAIVIFRLLAHKGRFEPLDLELFNLLATHAASALYASALYARVSEEARA